MRWYARDPRKQMLINARTRAKREGVPFDLDVEDITIPEHCPILGLRIGVQLGGGRGGRNCSPSLDRLDPAAGYVRGNVTVVSLKANRLKNQLSPEQLMLFARFYYEHAQRVKEEHHA
jgi:hypothetical protein